MLFSINIFNEIENALFLEIILAKLYYNKKLL